MHHSIVKALQGYLRYPHYRSLSLRSCLTAAHDVILCLSQFQLGTFSPGQPPGISSKTLLGGRDLTFESCPGAGNSTRAGILWKFKVKHFVRVLVLSVINTGVSQKITKQWGTLQCVISISNYAKNNINMCSGGDLCSLFISNFSETPCVKVGFNVRISLV